MEANHDVATGCHENDFNHLITDLDEIRSEMLRVEKIFENKINLVHEKHRESARNFLHYLALRQRDIRSLQQKLASYGLSSLGRSESHVLDNLDAVLRVLHLLAGSEVHRLAGEPGDDISIGRSTLERNTLNLLGHKPAKRDVRIMVTMPSDAASNHDLVRDLVDAGMDCMRINCAHDDEAIWAGMVANLNCAKKETRKHCQILMDLPGPKLRTGPIEPLPGVVKWRPRRNRYGSVIRPARIWLAAKENPASCPPIADACLSVAGDWLKKLRLGDTIKFLDARGLSRSMDVIEISESVVWTECTRTAYVAYGTMLQVLHPEDGKTVSSQLAQIEDLPPEPQPIHLKQGDLLLLTPNLKAGKPAVREPNGKLLSPATIGVSLPEIFADVRAGESIWFDDGKIGGVIRSVSQDAIEVEINRARTKGENLWADKGINLPDSELRLPSLTDEDVALLPFIAGHADLVGYSFVRSESDVEQLQAQLKRVGGEHLGIILKIETRHAVESLPHLLLAAMRSAAAGVMIARGDLAVECGYERTGELQEEIMWMAEAAHMPVIWATQVLENVAKTGQPSRAEITDAAMAERAECVMLNKGPYVVQAVQMLDDVLTRMQSHQTKKVSLLRPLNLARRFCLGENAC
jgi:pyruvate kinase